MSNPTGSILLRRGPTTDRLAFVPLDGEVIYDTTLKQMFVGDGITFGGRGISGVITSGDLLPPQATNNGKYLFTNGSIASWQTVDALPSQTGNDGKYLKTNAGVASWSALDPANNGLLTLTTAGIGLSGSQIFYANQSDNSTFTITSNATDLNTPLTVVSRDSSGNFAAGTITANITGNVSGNAGTVTNGVVTTGSYANPSWITSLALTQGGTGAVNRTDALTNLLPVGEANGYVLKTSGRGTYFWSSETGASGTQGQTISTIRNTIIATASQTVFTTSEYVVGAGQLRVYIDGVRQFPSEYTETSTTSFTLDVGVPAGTLVFVEIDAFVGQAITASNVVNAPAGNLISTTVQDALNELDQEKAPLASPTFTGTVGGITAAMVGLGNVTNESKATMFTNPTFTGTVSGITVTATTVGLGNVTNESKATMFTDPTFTGTVTGVSAAAVGLGNVTNESKATMFSSPTFGGAVAFSPATTVNFSNATVSGLPTPSADIPSGTKMMFVQTNAPTGWTKDTTHNNKAIRVVSGTAGSGGSVNFTSAFSSQGVSGTVAGNTALGSTDLIVAGGTVGFETAGGTVGGTTLASSQMPSHSHTPANAAHAFATNDFPTGTAGWSFITTGTVTPNNNLQANGGNRTASEGGGGSHNHTFGGTSHNHTFTGTQHSHSVTVNSHNHTFTGTAINLAVEYVDVIIATKN